MGTLQEKTFSPDVVIFGGGISGLLTLALLRDKGYQAILFEKNQLCDGQTIVSQGIIHGGIKYTFHGELSEAAKDIASMPSWWQSCLQGEGAISLETTQVLSKHYHLWSTNNLISKFSHFISKKLLQSDCTTLERENFPQPFNNEQFQGNLFQAEEWVIDVPSLVRNLYNLCADYIFQLSPEQYELIVANDRLQAIVIQTPTVQLNIKSQIYVLAAGAGNNDFEPLLPFLPKMQLRPLHMVWGYPAPMELYGHCIDHHPTPRISVTTHLSDKPVWYIGGRIAETGVNRSASEQINMLKHELSATLPWINCEAIQWQTFKVNRAEIMNPTGERPNSISLANHQNIFTAWPTKLTLAPQLAQTIVQEIASKIQPSKQAQVIDALNTLEKPSIATPPWVNIT